MAEYSLSFFSKNPEKLDYFTVKEIEGFIKKWTKEESYSFESKKTIANLIGYKDFTELKKLHKSILQKTVVSINEIDIPDVSSIIIKYGGYHTDSYKNAELIEAILDNSAELRKQYNLIEDYLYWIAIRKNSVLYNDKFRKMVKNYCLIRLSGGIPRLTPLKKVPPTILLLRENITHFNLINLPDEQVDSLNSFNNKIQHIDFHHVVEPINNTYLKLRLATILFKKDNTGIPILEYSKLKDKNLCKLINDRYKILYIQIEETLDITQCNLEKIKEYYGESSKYLKTIGVNKTELLNEFYQIVNTFSEEIINESLYGLEFIRNRQFYRP